MVSVHTNYIHLINSYLGMCLSVLGSDGADGNGGGKDGEDSGGDGGGGDEDDDDGDGGSEDGW